MHLDNYQKKIMAVLEARGKVTLQYIVLMLALQRPCSYLFQYDLILHVMLVLCFLTTVS
jgi:hypothetical protein